MSTRYVPGDAAVLVGDRGLVATARENADGLIALVDSDLVVLTVIDSLSHGSLANLPDFACVVVDGADLRVVVRGGFVARVGEQSWSGDGVATWREHTVVGGAGSDVVIETATVETCPELPVSAGIVLASRATWTSVAAPSRVSEPRPETEAAAAPPAGTPASTAAEPDDVTVAEPDGLVSVPDDATVYEPEPEHATAYPEQPAPPSFPPPSFPPPSFPPPPAPPAAPPARDPEVTVTESDLGLDTMFGATVVGPRTDDQPVPGDHDGRTITADQLRALREQAAAAQPALQAAVILPDGARHPVSPRLLIGRRPQARQVATADVPTLVTVNDPYVSSTHLEAAVVDGRVMVTDLSTNGTLITRPGQAPEQLVKGAPTEAVDGTRLSLSDELTVTVELKAGG
jgi:hypothetical protein